MRRELTNTSGGNRQTNNKEKKRLLFPDFKETFDAAEVRKCHEGFISSAGYIKVPQIQSLKHKHIKILSTAL